MGKNSVWDDGQGRFKRPADPFKWELVSYVKGSDREGLPRRVLYISGIGMVIIYVISSLMAFLLYMRPFSPLRNWLSDLGNKVINPTGSIFYNTGVLTTALLLVLFFLCFTVLRSEKNKAQNQMVTLTQVFGVLGAFSLAFSGLYSIDTPSPHSIWSTAYFFSLGAAFAFSVVAMQYETGCPLSLLLFGILTVTIDSLVSLFFYSKPIFEWITIALFLGYVAFLGIVLKNLANGPFDEKAAK